MFMTLKKMGEQSVDLFEQIINAKTS